MAQVESLQHLLNGLKNVNVFLSKVEFTEFVKERGTVIGVKLAFLDSSKFRVGDQILVGESIELAEQYQVLGISCFSSQNPELGYFVLVILLGHVTADKVPKEEASIWLVRPDEASGA